MMKKFSKNFWVVQTRTIFGEKVRTWFKSFFVGFIHKIFIENKY